MEVIIHYVVNLAKQDSTLAEEEKEGSCIIFTYVEKSCEI